MCVCLNGYMCVCGFIYTETTNQLSSISTPTLLYFISFHFVSFIWADKKISRLELMDWRRRLFIWSNHAILTQNYWVKIQLICMAISRQNNSFVLAFLTIVYIAHTGQTNTHARAHITCEIHCLKSNILSTTNGHHHKIPLHPLIFEILSFFPSCTTTTNSIHTYESRYIRIILLIVRNGRAASFCYVCSLLLFIPIIASFSFKQFN